MSRIQEILAKAERDGTARRTQTAELPPRGAEPAAVLPLRAGPPALEPLSFLNAAAPAPAGPPDLSSLRTEVATLHPLLVAAIDPHSAIAEQYRAVRARISHREETTPLRALMVTSPEAGDGKSLTIANLALAMAQEFQRRVVLVDADLRDPSVHGLFGIPGSPGLAEVLSGDASLDQAMVYLPDFRLAVLPAGAAPPYPTELLGSAAMRRVSDALRSRFDRVLLDLPAVVPLADAGTIAPLVDGIVMVVRAGVTQRPALEEALALFDDEKMVGVVLNEAT